MTLGKRIKIARERLKLTQKDVGDAFGITDAAVSQWERDKEKPDLDKISKLRGVLRVTYSWLLDGKGPPPDPEAPRLEDLQPADRDVVEGLIESLHSKRGRVA